MARGWVFGSGALRKVADLLFALLMMWSVLENIAGKKVAEKMLTVMRFSDHDMTDWKALGDGKSDQNETRSLDGFPELITRVN